MTGWQPTEWHPVLSFIVYVPCLPCLREARDKTSDARQTIPLHAHLLLQYADRLQEKQPSMSQMERAMETIVKTFHHHSGKKGDPDTLSWDEFKQLVNEDMSNILKVRLD